MNGFIFRLRSASRSSNGFTGNNTGATAVIFAISLVPLMGIVGTGIDYGKAYSARSQLQTAADSAALAGAATFANANPDPQGKAQVVFNLAIQDMTFGNNVTFAASPDNDTVNVTATARVSSPFLSIFGLSTIEVGVESGARLPKFKAEIVLVLDYSSSMNGSKYETMRDGAVDLVNLITTQQTNTDVSVSLVPFAAEVYTSLPGEFVLGVTAGSTWTNCTGDRKWPYNTTDSTPTGDDATKWGRVNSNDTIEPTEYDTCVDYSANNLITRPLTDDHAGTVAQLQAMTPYRGTNIALGLQFGWQMISPEAPYTQGTAYGSGKKKVVILLTDGRQHMKGFGTGGIRSTENAVANIDTLCAGIKGKNILLITVAYELSDPEGKAQLATCASSGDYYKEGDETSIIEVLNGVGHNLLTRKLRLIK